MSPCMSVYDQGLYFLSVPVIVRGVITLKPYYYPINCFCLYKFYWQHGFASAPPGLGFTQPYSINLSSCYFNPHSKVRIFYIAIQLLSPSNTTFPISTVFQSQSLYVAIAQEFGFTKQLLDLVLNLIILLFATQYSHASPYKLFHPKSVSKPLLSRLLISFPLSPTLEFCMLCPPPWNANFR